MLVIKIKKKKRKVRLSKKCVVNVTCYCYKLCNIKVTLKKKEPAKPKKKRTLEEHLKTKYKGNRITIVIRSGVTITGTLISIVNGIAVIKTKFKTYKIRVDSIVAFN